MSPPGEIRAVARAAPGRRVAGVGFLVLLGAILLWVALAHPPAELGWRLFLLACGTGALWSAWRQWEATRGAVVLTTDGLYEEGGTPIAPLRDIAKVERGLFVFKPSNGFLVRLTTPARRAWVPGLWWRYGRRVGVGGVMRGAETRIMADLLTAMLAARTEP